VGRGASCPPIHKNLIPALALLASSFVPLGFAPPCLLTFYYIPPLLAYVEILKEPGKVGDEDKIKVMVGKCTVSQKIGPL